LNRFAKKLLIESSYTSGQYRLAPEFLSLVITFRCCFRCEMCSIWQKIDAAQMSDEEWLAKAEDIKKSFPADTFVEINGGEPLIRKALVYPLIKSLKQRFHFVTLNSNAFLIDDETVKNLVAAGLDAVKISFYSLTPELHNSLRGNSGAHDHAKQAIENLSRANIKTEVGILVTRRNIDEVVPLVNYLNSLPNVTAIIQPLDESVESEVSKDMTTNHLLTELWPAADKVNALFDWFAENPRQVKNSTANLAAIRQYYLNPPDVLKYRCFAGQRSCIIYPNGEVSMCFKGPVLGNVRTQSIVKILRNWETHQERLKIKACGKYCRVIWCNFARGIKEVVRDKIK